ncbi:MAG: glutathione S-transferase [Sandaracinaceae bacterium]
MTPTLFVGNKNYSSWSLRPWLALTWGQIAFEERVIPLGVEGYGKSEIAAVRAVSPSGRVPVLHVDGAVIHESLAIAEWAAEASPSLWPSDPLRRAEARALACEMHGGFAAIRTALSMNIRRRMEAPPPLDARTTSELAHLFDAWSRALDRSGGPFLFGARTIADAMFAPVATRLRTYAIETPEPSQAYCTAILEDDAFRAWERAAEAETWTIDSAEALYR